MRLQRPFAPQDRVVLAADARLVTPDYLDDIIWALQALSDPPTLALETTYGLRARRMRLFPLFFPDAQRRGPGRLTLEDSPPQWIEWAPNYAALGFTPAPQVQGTLEWLIPNSSTATARLSLHNQGSTPVTLHLGWVAELSPNPEGRPMEPVRRHAVTVLEGETEGLHLLVFLTGGAEGVFSPYPALVLDLDLAPGQRRRLTLVHRAASDPEGGFEAARRQAARPWEAQLARLRMAEQAFPALAPQAPPAAWALAFARQSALRLLHGPWGRPPRRFALRAREPEHGFSPNGRGTDHPPAWSGLTVPELWYLSTAFLLPHAPEVAAELLRPYLEAQRRDGWIDAAPGPAGQRAHVLASPLLVDLAARIYAARPDTALAQQIFPPLWRFLQMWFSSEQDRDGDGLPEWHHPAQVGISTLPEFSPWHPWSTGADLGTVEDPALWALLYRACQALDALAPVAGFPQARPTLQAWAQRLHQAVQQAWDPRRGHPLRRDRDTHLSPSGRTLGQRRGPGVLTFAPCPAGAPPFRPVILLYTPQPLRPQITLHARSLEGHPLTHTLSPTAPWYEGRMAITAPHAYACLERLEIAHIPPATRVVVKVADLTRTDLTLWLPFWAGMLTPHQRQQVLRRLQSPRGYHRPHGLPLVPTRRPKAEAWAAVHMLWNLFLIEGLERFAQRALAADLLQRLWQTAGQTLLREGHLREAYHAETGHGLGQRNTLLGLPPLSPGLRLAGLGALTPQEVVLTQHNAFTQPLEVRWRGVQIHWGPHGGRLVFPGGQEAPLPSPPARLMLQSKRSAEREPPDPDA